MSLIDLSQPDVEMPLGQPGAAVEYVSYVDYFGFDETHKHYLPDGKQYIEFKAMTEGQRAKYEAMTSRDIRFNRKTDDAAIRMDAASDRRALIEASVVGWNLWKVVNGEPQPVAFSSGSGGSTLSQWIQGANPRLVNDLVAAIRNANDWMTEDMTSAMIREEIVRLQEMLVQAEEREARQKNS